MSKKDFELIARVLREAPADATPGQMAYLFAAELVATNPRFDTGRFVAACNGVDSHDSAGREVRYAAS